MHKRIFSLLLILISLKASSQSVLVPTIKLHDGYLIPQIALGTWLGNSTQGKILPKDNEVERAVEWAIEAGYRHIDTAFAYKTEPQVGRGLAKLIAQGLVKRDDIFITTKGKFITPKDKDNEVVRAVEWAIGAGYRHIDTAFLYQTEPRTEVGRGLAKLMAQGLLKREDLFITTKLWNDAHARDAVVPALRASLENLKLDYVDLYLIHWPIGQFANLTLDTTDYLETWRGMMDAKSLNLTRSIGVSNFNQSQIDRILDTELEKPAALQIEINLNLQQPDLLNYCKNKDIAVMAFTPFGSLFPSKAATNAPPPRVDNVALVEIAERHNKTVPQIVLRYLIEIGVVPLPKSLNKQRIEENINIFDFSLTPEERDTLKAFDKQYRTIPQWKWIEHPNFPFGDLVNVVKQ